ncbi:hypothetical protein GCM10023310_68850 [Paenibacillus vulneris]|uniref:Uncharacterized protein n=1 Tax=Paenibacillus vulneris TaxID=1133364 RepID=A0ABW3UFD5_9BACL
MCSASKLVKNMLEELKSKKEELLHDVTLYDRQVSKLYHEFESADLTLESGIQLAKKMQGVLRERRGVKYDLMQYKTLITTLDTALRRLAANEKEYFKDNENYKQYIS